MPFPLSLGAASEFWHVVKELNPATIRAEAERRLHIVVLGKAGAKRSSVVRALIGEAAPASGALSEADVEDERPTPWADLYIYVLDEAGAARLEIGRLAELRHRGRPLLVVADRHTGGALTSGQPDLNGVSLVDEWDEDKLSKAVGDEVLRALADMHLALARQLAGMRRAVGDALIGETARVNAEFALASDLPAAIPLVGGFFGSAADLLVLTKNQGMLVFKLAAVHGRDLRSNVPLLMEIAPVVGAAFFWRTVARTLVGMLPPVVSAIPKTTIAYAGTYVVGKMAQYYYANDLRPTGQMVKRFTEEALDSFKGTAAGFKTILQKTKRFRGRESAERWHES